MRAVNCGFVLVLVSLLTLTACRRRAGKTPSGSEPSTPGQPGAAETAAGEKTYAAPPPPPATATPPESETARFNTPEPMNMYATRYAGDYQTQLDAYNRVLRKWQVDSSNAPRNLQEIMGTFNSPKPPQPPAGRQLVYDPPTKTVRLR
jgi:hypothetical protein